MSIPFKYTLRSMWQRKSRTILTVIGLAAVIAIFVATTSFATGMKSAFESTGSPDNIVVLQKSAFSQSLSALPRSSYEAIRYLPLIKHKGDTALASPELDIEPWVSLPGTEEEIFMVARGVEPVFFDVADTIHLVEGTRELRGNKLLVGAAARQKLGGIGVGDPLVMFGERWIVSGSFEAAGSSVEFAILADLSDLMRATNRTEFSSLTIKADSAASVKPLIRALEDDRRFLVTALGERDYYADRGKVYGVVGSLAVLISLIVTLGAVFGGMNTMYTAVAGRTREVGTLGALGFSHGSILFSFVSEALLLGAAGGLLGIAAGMLVDGVRLNIMSASVRFNVTPGVMAVGFAMSLVVGLLGGLLPAWQASRLRVVEAIRKA